MSLGRSSYTLYVLRCADGTFYTGITTDLQRRLWEHNRSPKGAKYTRSRRPVIIVYTRRYRTRSTALRAEASMKAVSRSEKIAMFRDRDNFQQ